jgi:diguanylate cyclase (GGDEF)-like protein
MQKDPSSLELKISSENDAKALFKEKLNAMQDKFKASLPARFAEIQQAWERVQAASEIEDDLDVLYRLVHTLTGSAGTFGYQQLSRDSRALEILLKGLVSHADINYDEHRLQIQEMIYGLVKVTEGGMESALSFAAINPVKRVLEQYSEMIDLPVIFMSARQDIEARLQAVRAKGQAYFLKPVNLSALLNQIREMTNRIESEPYQVVVVDDDPALVSLITFILEEYGMHVASVTDPKLVLEVIGRHKPDLILMDVHMPWCNGIELAQVIRQHHDLSMIPIIFLSSETDENIQFQAVLKGGDDFLSKPIDINKLPKFIQSRAQRARSVNSLMIRDGLTGLFNHTYIKQAVETEMNRLERNGTEFSVVMMDVDFFKKVNDTYGHIAGDQVLRSLSHFLVQHLRKTDKVGRYGGEEFMVVLPETTLEDAVSVMQTILDKFGEIIHHSAENDFHITFSAGVISSRVTQDIEVMLENVDKGLYKAKNNGRNQVTAIKKLIE